MSRKELSRSELDQLAKLAKLRDDQIDTNDIPEAPAENWMQARRGGFYRTERSYGRFYRAIPLPDGVKPEQAQATFNNGVLEIRFPEEEEPDA